MITGTWTGIISPDGTTTRGGIRVTAVMVMALRPEDW